MNFKVVEIIWMDAQSSLIPMSIEEAKHEFKPLTTKSIGYLIHETKEYIILAFMDYGNGLYKHWQVIPIGMIKQRKVLKR